MTEIEISNCQALILLDCNRIVQQNNCKLQFEQIKTQGFGNIRFFKTHVEEYIDSTQIIWLSENKYQLKGCFLRISGNFIIAISDGGIYRIMGFGQSDFWKIFEIELVDANIATKKGKINFELFDLPDVNIKKLYYESLKNARLNHQITNKRAIVLNNGAIRER